MTSLYKIKQVASLALMLLLLAPILAFAQNDKKEKETKKKDETKKEDVSINALPPPGGGGGGGTYCNSISLRLVSQGCSSATLQAYPPADCVFSYYLYGPNGLVTTGNGETVNFTVSQNGNYYLKARNPNGEFTSNTVSVSSIQPAVYSMTGGGSFCAGGSAAVGLSGSQGGVSYQLRRDGINVGSAISGTGSALSFGNQTVGGTYTVVGTNSSGCATTMSGSAVVTVNPAPATPTVSSSSRIGAGTVTLNVSSPVTGYTYHWYSVSSGGTHFHTGTSYSPNLSSSKTYYVSVRNSQGCESGRRAVTATIYPSPVVTVQSGSTDLVPGASVTFSTNYTYTTYQWLRDGVAITGATSRTVVVKDSGIYSVRVANSGAINTATSPGKAVRLARDAQNMNYIVENTVMKAGVQSAADADRLPVGEVVQKITYFDGLGRELQTVQTQGSPFKKDIVTPVSYDALGRVEKTYLPYVMGQGGAYRPDATAEQAGFYSLTNQANPTIAKTSEPWAVPVYEASPLNRVLKQGAPGEAWQPDGLPAETSTDHTIKLIQRANVAGEVRLWQVNAYTPSESDNPMGTAMRFDGVNDYLLVGDKAPLKMTESVTVEAWIYPTGNGSNATSGGIIASKEGEYWVARYPDGSVGWALANTSPGWKAIKSTAKAPLYTWSHVAVAYGGGYVRTYLNGRLAHTYSASGAIGDANTTQNDFRIGGRQSGSQYFNGAIDELRVWSTVKTEAEIAGGMRKVAASSAVGLAGYWRMSEGTGTTAADASVNGNTATLANGAAWATKGLYPRSATYTSQGFYEKGMLYVTETRDEQGALTVEYKDLQGRVVMKKVQEAATVDSKTEAGFMITQYLYDDLGNLRLVIQPEGYRKELPAPDGVGRISLTPTFQDRWCFRYEYDGRRRLIEKQVPGSGAVQMVYNKRDEVVLTQDANQRGLRKWSFTKYEVLGRPIMTGELVTTTANNSQDAMQKAVDAYNAGAGRAQFESRTGPTGLGYTLANTYPSVTEANLLSVTYYDDYNYGYLSGYAFKPDHLAGVTASNSRVRGQVTGTYVKSLHLKKADPNDPSIKVPLWLTTATFYDEKYRPVQTVAQNHLGGVDRTTTRYDFTGKVLETLTTHEKGTTATYAVHNAFTYDHMGRSLKTLQRTGQDAATITSLPAVTLSENSYNELGQLVEKRLHKQGSKDYLQKVDYRYNIRGWLASINDRQLVGQEGDPRKDLFGLELTYNESMQLGTAGQFNGNISEVLWASIGDGVQRGYGYGYDQASRLKSGLYKANTGSGWTAETDRYNVSGLTYDHNGNILSLQRRGMTAGKAYDPAAARTWGLVDNLTYRYEGNRLATVNDAVKTVGPAGDFVNGVTRTYSEGTASTWEYGYDANGNMTADQNKKITKVTYNQLNLPAKVTITNQGSVRFYYTAGGQKLRKTVYATGKDSVVTDYVGMFVHQGDTLFAHTAEGRVVQEPGVGDGWRYEYHLKDHLGNLRVTFAEPGAVDVHLATMETERDSLERQFTGFENTKIGVNEGLDHTHKTAYPVGASTEAVRLNSYRGAVATPGLSLRVLPGDTVTAKVYAKYVDLRRSQVDASVIAGALLGTATGYTAVTDAGGLTQVKNSTGSVVATLGGADAGAAPTASLHWILFDEEFSGDTLEAGYIRLNGQAAVTDLASLNGAHQMLELTVPVIQKAGYLRVEVRHDAVEDVDVYFDDLEVEHRHGILVQENHYDPWGLNLAGIERQGTPDHLFQYNGKERQTELGLNWINYGFRNYDPQIGRWHSPDAVAHWAESLSPYRYGLNNPVRYIDLLGLWEATNGGYKTDKKEEIERFMTYLDIERNALGNSPSIDQANSFVEGEMEGGLGRLSNGSKLVSTINIDSYDRGTHREWVPDGKSAFSAWKEVQNDLTPVKENVVLDKMNTVVNYLGMNNDVKGGLGVVATHLGGDMSPYKGYMRYASVTGKVLGATSAGISLVKLMNKPTIGNGLIFAVDIALMGTGPLGGLVGGVAEATGVKDAVATGIDEYVEYNSFISKFNKR
ncbi:LamG-like jellyroll fold domain-containing protein [Pontibacter korlensis]|uniref:LamG-like jellyroll fold domain-containing protein n=1 Tax=Pontibacter korlensis TaxID=400092 RepID=A0A0E3UV21_9BACT|nr:LamG-like jellyroll fold domain-containing protein [Pontibacter korlensis]AKD02127.1 hypothetical protein PKOR_01960 [Pontibacter korlensis]